MNPEAGPAIHLLFICSRNQWRSPTAERLWARETAVKLRSAGTSRSARRRVSAKDILWADIILVMEPHHKDRLLSDHRAACRQKPIHVLDIPDDYGFMDPELIALLRSACSPWIPSASGN